MLVWLSGIYQSANATPNQQVECAEGWRQGPVPATWGKSGGLDALRTWGEQMWAGWVWGLGGCEQLSWPPRDTERRGTALSVSPVSPASNDVTRGCNPPLVFYYLCSHHQYQTYSKPDLFISTILISPRPSIKPPFDWIATRQTEYYDYLLCFSLTVGVRPVTHSVHIISSTGSSHANSMRTVLWFLYSRIKFYCYHKELE